MDGFISDVEPSKRKGLHARDPEEMVAWDSLAGHHKGLTAVMPVFRKSTKRRQDEEVFELHRNEIVHGSIVNYNNQVVATKAWNMLCAVVDWASAKRLETIPEEPKPTLRGTVALIRDHLARQRYREEFKPWSRHPADVGFGELEVVQQATRFLASWQARRWALVAEALESLPSIRNTEPSGRAVKAKDIYERSPLKAFEITQVSFPQASVALVRGSATIGDKAGRLELRWILQRPDGRLAMASDAGAKWMLAVWPPDTFIKDEDAEST